MTAHPRTLGVTVLAVGLLLVWPLLGAGSEGPTPAATPAGEVTPTETATSSTGSTDATTPAPEATPPRASAAPDRVPEIPYRLSPEGFRVAQGSGPVVGTWGEIRTYTVEVEPMTGVDLGEVLPFVRTTLEDPDRGWTSHGEVRLQWVDDVAAADLRVVVARPDTVDRHCAEVDLETNGIYSCWDGEHTMLNAWRWHHGAADFGDDLEGYRTYLVNHEVGHALGRTHLDCPAPGAVAPVMVQQTVTTGVCEPNGWPWP